jgi:hypothetical protein
MSFPPHQGDPSPGERASTGLPGFRTWTKVYLLVIGTFVLWVGLLTALTLMFS